MSTTLLIGASRGIGLEMARQYARQGGTRLIATARDDAALGRLKELGAQTLRLDVADPASVSALSGQLDGEKIDVAWYIAGVIDRADARTPPTQPDFDRVMHANVLGAMQVIPQVAPLVEAARGRFGFITSQMGHIGSVSSGGAWLYRVSKAALNMAVKAAQPSYPDALFALFHPGWVQTEMGGANATVTVPDSAAGLIGSLAALTAADRGVFMAYDGKRYDGW